MSTDFSNINYLKKGNKRQQEAYLKLNELSVFENLQAYNPILTGTIPIGIDLADSDLDIICECTNHMAFIETLTACYSDKDYFQIKTSYWNHLKTTIATFRYGNFDIEIFGQDCPTQRQNAYRHMLIEHQILNSKNADFRAEIIRLKRAGLKTEPAFSKLLGLQGNPYEALLQFEL